MAHCLVSGSIITAKLTAKSVPTLVASGPANDSTCRSYRGARLEVERWEGAEAVESSDGRGQEQRAREQKSGSVEE
eukprot:4258811-Pyramimonas_sp.AAC.1